MPGPGEPITDDLLGFLDHLAGLTADPAAGLAGLRALYRADDRIRVPAAVHNALLNRTETI
jgi:hypothetical protein